MPRPRLCRRLGLHPRVTFYKPQGVPLNSIEVIELTHEEWEALRLKHELELDQTDAAKKMNTSQSTFQRILASAHKKIARAIINGHSIKITK